MVIPMKMLFSGMNNQQFHRALNHCQHLGQPDNNPNSVAFMPFVWPIFNWISRVLARHNIKSVGLPLMKLSSLLRLVKDHLRLRTPSVYRIPCEFGRVSTEQTGCSVDNKLKEHQQHIQLEHPDKWAIARDTAINPTMPPSSPQKTRYTDQLLRRPLRLNSTLKYQEQGRF
jgi:hypothetical protein